MKRSTTIVTVIFLLGISLSTWVVAQDTSPKDPYSGDIWSRSTLTGDWGGSRNQLADKGITFNLSVDQVEQGVVNGGKSSVWEYSGRGDMVMNVDSGKLGWWPGGFFNLELEGNWGSSIDTRTGALMPVNSSELYPAPGGDIFGVSALNFTQFLSPYFGLTIGKYATVTTTSGDMNEFAHGKGATNFMNLAFNFYPGFAFTVPYSTLGTGAILLPTKDPNEAIVSFLVMSANGTVKNSGFDDLNSNAVSFALEGRVRTDFFGLTGHQLLGATDTNKKIQSIDQRLGSIIETRTLAEKKGSWNVYYNFDQYVYEPQKNRGVGLFGRLGVSDGNPNFMKYFGSFGVGGKGMFASRPHDEFGLGYYYIDINNPSLQGPLRTRNFLRNESGFEAFYNVAITPWLLLTPDLQVVKGAQKHAVNLVQGPLGLLPRIQESSIDTSTVLGVRLQMLF